MFCKNCGNEVDSKAVICTNCGHSLKVKKSVFKKWWFWVIIGFCVFVVIGAASSASETSDIGTDSYQSDTTASTKDNAPSVPEEFAGACPIEVSASIADNIIGVPELGCNIKNKSNKEIAAVKLYFMPVDVYGDEVNTIFTTNELYTDNVIGANASCTRSWQLLDQDVKSGNLYVYSVYFSDGSEWGDKDASLSKIKKYGVKISVEN